MTKAGADSALPLLWVVTDQLPFPPRNGITLPIFNYLAGLKQTHRVRLILLEDTTSAVQQADLNANEDIYGPIDKISLVRNSKIRRLFSEISGREMYQHGWKPLVADSHLQPQPDGILVSPMSAVAKWRTVVGAAYPSGIIHAAAVNDCTAAEYYFRGQTQVGNFKSRFKASLDKWRSKFIGHIEAQLLEPYNTIFLQTKRDYELMSKLVSPRIAAKVTLAPNGVSRKYSSVSITNGNRLVFVGELSGEYGNIVYWLVNEVWPLVADINQDAVLQIIGRGASSALKLKMKASARIEHVEYVEDLAQVYVGAMLAICPIFKGFGLINKTIEAMACGLPVVGGEAAFNGISGFEPNVHGAVCSTRSTNDFAATLAALLKDEQKRKQIGAAAKQLIGAGFNWDTTIQIVGRAMTRRETT